MCGRFTSLLSPELLAVIRETFGVPVPEPFEPHYNIAPTQMVRVLRNEGDHNRFDLMKWGLVPFWEKDTSRGAQMINARSETVREKPAFRQAIKYRRCIIPSSGFYEWQRTESRKQPYFISMADSSPMYLAGIWEQWKSPMEDTFLESFSILTTEANKLIAPIHPRMPVILRPEDYALWLDTQIMDPTKLQHLYKPISPELLTVYRVSAQMNSPKFIGPECVAPV